MPTTACGTTKPVVTGTDTTVAVAGGPAVNVKRVQVTYSHNYMFVGPIIGLMGGTFSTNVPITTVAVMRKEL